MFDSNMVEKKYQLAVILLVALASVQLGDACCKFKRLCLEPCCAPPPPCIPLCSPAPCCAPPLPICSLPCSPCSSCGLNLGCGCCTSGLYPPAYSCLPSSCGCC